MQASFQERYSTLLGLDIKASRFLNNVAEVVKAHADPSAGAASVETHAAAATHGQPHGAAAPQQQPEKVVVAPLQLGRRIAPEPAIPEPLVDAAGLERRLHEIKQKITNRVPADVVLALALGTFAQHLGTKKMLLLVGTPARDALVVRFGFREDVDAISKELRFP
ncbi:MAG: hypothetical protein QM756_47615 [Polyangiaceae bacterium]